MPSKPKTTQPDPEPLLLWIGLELVRRRKDANAQVQKELAAAAELSKTSISDIERGKKNIRIGTLQRLAWAFHVSVPQFLQSRVPARFHKPGSQEWHDLLEAVLDSSSETAITTAKNGLVVAAGLVGGKTSGKPR